MDGLHAHPLPSPPPSFDFPVAAALRAWTAWVHTARLHNAALRSYHATLTPSPLAHSHLEEADMDDAFPAVVLPVFTSPPPLPPGTMPAMPAAAGTRCLAASRHAHSPPLAATFLRLPCWLQPRLDSLRDSTRTVLRCLFDNAQRCLREHHRVLPCTGIFLVHGVPQRCRRAFSKAPLGKLTFDTTFLARRHIAGVSAACAARTIMYVVSNALPVP